MESLEQLSISNFNTNKVKNMAIMFSNAKKIKNLDLRNFNTSSVITMQGMFQNMESLEQVNISNFNTSNVTDMSFMFGCGAIAYNCKLSEIQGLTNLDTSNVTTMQAMFVNQKNFRTLDLSSFNTPKLTNTNYMFLATNLTTIYVSSRIFDFLSCIFFSLSLRKRL